MPSKLLLPLFTLFLLISAGCGGSGSGNGSDSSLEVTQLTPGNNSDEISRDATISVHFNRSISPSLLDELSLSVFSPEEKIEGKVSVGDDGKSLVFSPSDLLQYSTEFEVKLSGKLDINWDFATLRNDTFDYGGTAFSAADIGDGNLFLIYIPLLDGGVSQQKKPYLLKGQPLMV